MGPPFSCPHPGRLTGRAGLVNPERLHPEAEGELITTFEMQGTGTKVRLDLVYGLKQPALFGPITDRLFVRGPMRASLQRSLRGLRAEASG